VLEDAKDQAKKSIFALRQQVTRSRQGINNQIGLFRGNSGNNQLNGVVY
jgi:hypothetical protein